jgi:hypothetical protein
MWHPYDDLREIGQRLTATVPRIRAAILDGMIVAGMVVLPRRRHTARLIPGSAFTCERHFSEPAYDRFTGGFAPADMRTAQAPLDEPSYLRVSGAGRRLCNDRMK